MHNSVEFVLVYN